MSSVFEAVGLYEVSDDLLRNIKSIRQSQELFDDLSDDPGDWQTAKAAELAVKPRWYTDPPIIHRPFQRARYFNAIRFPFENWARSRYSIGRFGVWYGSDELLTTVHETVYHWLRFLAACNMTTEPEEIVSERRVYRVRCDAVLLDFRPAVERFPALVDPTDYSYAQSVGEQIHRQGHPGVVSRSARCDGDVYAVFRERVLSGPRHHCELSYRLIPGHDAVRVERQRGRRWLSLALQGVRWPSG